MTWYHPFQPFEYWADLAEDTPDFLIEGLLHSATNTVSGKPTVGKTRLVAAMAAAVAGRDATFCGHEITDHGRVSVISTDAGEAQRWGLRMREHGLDDGTVGIARFNSRDWRLYSEHAKGHRLLILDNLTGMLGSAKIGDDDAARAICEPLAEIAEHGTTVVMIAHSAKNNEALSGRYTPTGVMGSTVYQSWERLNIHIHDVTEPNVRNLLVRSNDDGQHSYAFSAKWGRASAEWEQLSESEDSRPRTDETHAGRIALFTRIANDPELRGIKNKSEIGRRLHATSPDEWETSDAARMDFNRAVTAAGGEFVGGRWQGKTAA